MTPAQRLKVLRTEWRYWRHPGRYGAPVDFCITCPTRCGECEGDAADAYRADRLAEIKAEAAVLEAAR